MKKRAAVFTLQRNEHFHLPLWLGYYGLHFDQADMYVLDHDSEVPEVRDTLRYVKNVQPVHNDMIYDAYWYIDVVNAFRDKLMVDYEYVLFTDVDEWVVPKEGSLADFIAAADKDAYRCTGYEVIEDRMHFWRPACKPLLARIPLQWDGGCHESKPDIEITDDLFLYHLHRLDFQAAWEKRERYQAHPNKYHLYQQVVNKEQYRTIFQTSATNQGPALPLDARLVAALNEVR